MEASKEKCGAKNRRGKSCQNPAGFKTEHPGIGSCHLHGGCTPTHERAASTEIARRECARLGIKINTTPGQAILEEVREAAGNVAYYRYLVQQLQDKANGAHEGVYSGDKPHVLVVLYNEERGRLREASLGALRANVEARMVQIAEADAERIADAQMRALIDMGLDDRLEEFREHFNTRLGSVQPAHLGAAADAA